MRPNSAPEIGLSEVSADILEAVEPLLGLSRVNLGDTIAGRVPRTCPAKSAKATVYPPQRYPVLTDSVYIFEDTHMSRWRGPFMDRPDRVSVLDFARQRCTDLMGWTSDVPRHEARPASSAT